MLVIGHVACGQVKIVSKVTKALMVLILPFLWGYWRNYPVLVCLVILQVSLNVTMP